MAKHRRQISHNADEGVIRLLGIKRFTLDGEPEDKAFETQISDKDILAKLAEVEDMIDARYCADGADPEYTKMFVEAVKPTEDIEE